MTIAVSHAPHIVIVPLALREHIYLIQVVNRSVHHPTLQMELRAYVENANSNAPNV